MDVTKLINEAVQSIQLVDKKRKHFVEKLLPLKNKNFSDLESSEILEEKLVFEVESSELNEKIAGVDSGFVGKNLFAFDLLLIRAVAVIFSYKHSKLVESTYYPNFFSFPEPILTTSALEKDEFQCSKSLHRLIEEVRISKKVIEKFSPHYLFIDGSIVPQYADKPRKNSKVESFYHKLLKLFQEFYEVAEKNNCELVACVEDSRGNRFKGIVQEHLLQNEKLFDEVLDNCSDSVLLDYLLKKGQRSFAFKYTCKIKEHPILNDFKEQWAEKIHAFYLKPSAFDRPLRVEFLSNEKGKTFSKHVNEIASKVFALSSMHREYAYPSVLIEADLRARLKPEEINIMYDKIIDKLGKHFKLKLRRGNRPFK